jgi:tetratricopeptide (TPR) repeat protein
MRGNKHILLFVLLLFLFQTQQANAQTFPDAQFTGLMKNSKYPEAAQLASVRLKVLPLTAKSERLFYTNKLGFAQFRMGNFDSAYQVDQQAIELTRYTSDSALISESWQLMAYAYNRKDQLDSALYYSQKLLEYAIRNNDHKKHGNALPVQSGRGYEFCHTRSNCRVLFIEGK